MQNRSPAFAALVLALSMSFGAAPAVNAKPSLGEIPEIHDGLFAVALADEIRKRCDSVGARMITAYSFLNDLKGKARAMGYSDEEIEDFVTSKDEKKKMRARGEAWLRARGVTIGEAEGYCRVGREEIRGGTPIGVLLRAW